MTTAVVEQRSPIRKMQGIEVPATSVRPAEFFDKTSRHITAERTPTAFNGLGGTDTVMIRKSDILAQLLLRFSGTLTITPGTGTVATTGRWPYDLARNVRFNANGQSNLLAASGLKFKVRDFVHNQPLTDRGISQTVAGAARTQGTLAQDGETWGVGSQTSAIAGGSYAVELEWVLPVCDDEVDLAGAIFCATTSTDLELIVDWATQAQLFALTGNATVALTGNFSVVATKYAIPEGPDGEIIIPDLSLFHQLIQTPGIAPVNGPNEQRLSGQGPGKSVLRLLAQVWNNTGTASEAPLVMSDTNFGTISWKYASSEEPDRFLGGTHLREHNARWANTDIGGIWGFANHEFAAQNALRDIVDMGTHSELRHYFEIASGVALSNAKLEMVQELMFRAGD